MSVPLRVAVMVIAWPVLPKGSESRNPTCYAVKFVSRAGPWVEPCLAGGLARRGSAWGLRGACTLATPASVECPAVFATRREFLSGNRGSPDRLALGCRHEPDGNSPGLP